MLFVTVTLGVMCGTLLASFIAVAIATNKKVMKWYTKKTLDMSKELVKEIEDEDEDF